MHDFHFASLLQNLRSPNQIFAMHIIAKTMHFTFIYVNICVPFQTNMFRYFEIIGDALSTRESVYYYTVVTLGISF